MVKAGQVLYDDDPRHRGRKVEVLRIEGIRAVCMSGLSQVKVGLDRIFGDGPAEALWLLNRRGRRPSILIRQIASQW